MHGKNIMYVLWTWTHCTIDYTIDRECLHCRWHCSVMKALSLLFFSKKVLLRVLSFLFPMPKAVGFGCKSLLKGVWFGLATRPNVIGLSFQPYPMILGMARQQNPTILGLAMLLGFIEMPNIFTFIFFASLDFFSFHLFNFFFHTTKRKSIDETFFLPPAGPKLDPIALSHVSSRTQ